ncbi:hypothetical protein [Spirosoma flavum]|uniref:Uncharacterized protein n=1 Tax=Spirosoma flavum TaxID=2048557 RepID=A0ABW6AUM6_9BACT
MAGWHTFSIFVLLTGQIGKQSPRPERIAFVLKNPVDRYQSFYVLSGGDKQYFSMHPFEKKPQNWPVGAQVYRLQGSPAQNELLFVLQARQAGTTVLAQSMGSLAAHLSVVAPALMTIRVLNRSALSKHVVLISYSPNEPQNGTYIFELAPGMSSQRQFRVGTTLFLATSLQEQQIMRGEPMDNQSPFWLVGPTDNGKTIPLPD